MPAPGPAYERAVELASTMLQWPWPCIDDAFARSDLQWLPDVTEGGKFYYLLKQLSNRSEAELARLDEVVGQHREIPVAVDPPLELFISHHSDLRQLAGEIAQQLAPYRVAAFVAHDAIEFGHDWRDVIVAHLRSCHALLALVSPEFGMSQWCDQEVGWALGRGVPVMSVDVGKAPYGFFGSRQAIPYRGDAQDLATRVVRRCLELEQISPILTRAFTSALEDANTYDEAAHLVNLLAQATYWDENLIRRVERVPHFNDQVHDSRWGATRRQLESITSRVRSG